LPSWRREERAGKKRRGAAVTPTNTEQQGEKGYDNCSKGRASPVKPQETKQTRDISARKGR